MNVLNELKKAWDNAFTSKEEKKASSSGLDALKDEILGGKTDALPDKPVLPDAPQYEKMDKDLTSDETIAAKAESAFKEYENQTLKGIEEEMKAQREKLGADKENAQKTNRETQLGIDETYDGARRNTENDALKRGLARSSIAINRVADVEKARADKQAQTQQAYADMLSTLDGELSDLDVKRQRAINDFNISLAVKIQEKMDELKQKRETANREALQYNNSIAEKQAKAAADKQKTESELYTEALKQKQYEDELLSGKSNTNAVYQSNYEKMDATLSQMNRSDAAKLLKEDMFFRDNLSDYLYYRLYDKYAR